MRLRLTVVVLLLSIFSANATYAGWNGLAWGVSKSEVENVLKKKLVPLSQKNFYGLADKVTFFGVKCSFAAQIEEGKLRSVHFFENGGSAISVCSDIFTQLNSRYLKVFAEEKKKDEILFMWQDGDTYIVGKIEAPDFGEHSCSISYGPVTP